MQVIIEKGKFFPANSSKMKKKYVCWGINYGDTKEDIRAIICSYLF